MRDGSTGMWNEMICRTRQKTSYVHFTVVSFRIKGLKFPFCFPIIFSPILSTVKKKKKLQFRLLKGTTKMLPRIDLTSKWNFFGFFFFFCCFDKTEFSNICSQFYYLLSRRFRLFCSFPYHISNSSGLGDRILIYAISAETFLTLA